MNYPRFVTFAGHLIAVERHHVFTRAELLRKWCASESYDFLAQAEKELRAGDVKHWSFLSPVIEAAELERNAMVLDNSTPPDYGAAIELRAQARALKEQINRRAA